MFFKKKNTPSQIAENLTKKFRAKIESVENLPNVLERFEGLFDLENEIQMHLREKNAESVKRGNVAAAIVGGLAGLSGGGAGAVYAADAAQKFADASSRQENMPVTFALTSLEQELLQRLRNIVSYIPTSELQKSSKFIKFSQRFPEYNPTSKAKNCNVGLNRPK